MTTSTSVKYIYVNGNWVCFLSGESGGGKSPSLKTEMQLVAGRPCRNEGKSALLKMDIHTLLDLGEQDD